MVCDMCHGSLHTVLFAALYSGGCGGRSPFARGAIVIRHVLETRALRGVSAGSCAPCVLEAEKDVRRYAVCYSSMGGV